jgi:hypothetical protein
MTTVIRLIPGFPVQSCRSAWGGGEVGVPVLDIGSLEPGGDPQPGLGHVGLHLLIRVR